MGSEPYGRVCLAGRFLFAAADSTNGREMWRSDGTSATTVLLKNIAPINLSSNPDHWVRLGTRVLFAADDQEFYGSELWQTDGTTAGTKLLKDINQQTLP